MDIGDLFEQVKYCVLRNDGKEMVGTLIMTSTADNIGLYPKGTVFGCFRDENGEIFTLPYSDIEYAWPIIEKGKRLNASEGELSLNVFDYLTDDEIKKMAEEELRAAFARQFQKESDVERVLTNLSYEYIFKLVENELGENAETFKEMLKEHVVQAIEDNKHLEFIVFRRADAWDRTESPAVKWLDEVLRECKPKIEEEVYKRIEKYPFYELRDEIMDTIYECIERKLFNKEG